MADMTDASGRSLLSVLRERGFVYKTTDDETADKPLERLLEQKRVTAYVGFDPTASSLHVGHLVAVMGLAHLQRSGHRPLVIVGGGTGMVGDPSGKKEMRRVLSLEEIQANLEALKTQLSRYLDIAPAPDPAETRGIMLNNAEWLLPLNYVEFLREIGCYFSVNRMLAMESVKLRLESETGLSFLEFNYCLLQAYDFLVLYRQYGCELQMGGSDQWGNIVAGADLIRRVAGGKAHGITFPLVMTATGEKMGKTVAGAVWLDPGRTSPYEYYQYWINTDDRDVGRFLRLFTFLPMEEIAELEKLQGADIRKAKERLAFEATAVTHGTEEAEKARSASKRLFAAGGGGDGSGGDGSGGDGSGGDAGVPKHSVPRRDLEQGVPAIQLFVASGLCESRNAARRLARQGGLYVHGEAISEDRVIRLADLKDGGILLRSGKKKHVKVVVGDS